MCGIAGIISPYVNQYQEVLKKMTEVMEYRGPDESGFAYFEGAALGHRRLSILDLSPTGQQPMYSNTKNECIILNGEIYGFQALKKEFNDYPYQGTSDTEVILAMYQKMGKNLLQKLPGMFAFAIWDEQKKELFCARDRFGEKPFYYAVGKNKEFIFGSEIKTILASGLVEPELDTEQLSHYLQYGYINPNLSIYKNIHNLPPAHSLVFSNEKLSITKYYEIPFKEESIGIEEAVEKFRYLLGQSVEKQMIADVPVGSFLSGGLDSSTIVAEASSYTNSLKTLCYGYSLDNINELGFAKSIADKYSTDHVEVLDENQEITEVITDIYKRYDEPINDTSLVPLYLIYKEAAKHLKVILTGDVGDELFGGYTFYNYGIELDNKGFYQSAISKMVRLADKLSMNVAKERMVRATYTNVIDFHLKAVRNYFSPQEISSLGLQKNQELSFSFTPDKHNYNSLMRMDMERYVPGNLLNKGDRTSMLNSIESRIPFLDKDFVEFCINLPSNLKVTATRNKYILREAYSQAWSDEIVNRRKNGFAAHVHVWFEDEKLQALSHDLLKNKNSEIFDYLNYDEVQKKLNHNLQHWSLLILALWFKNKNNFL